jgi:hypothetical protein
VISLRATSDANGRAGLMVNEFQKVVGEPQLVIPPIERNGNSVVLNRIANYPDPSDRRRSAAVNNTGLARNPEGFRNV